MLKEVAFSICTNVSVHVWVTVPTSCVCIHLLCVGFCTVGTCICGCGVVVVVVVVVMVEIYSSGGGDGGVHLCVCVCVHVCVCVCQCVCVHSTTLHATMVDVANLCTSKQGFLSDN